MDHRLSARGDMPRLLDDPVEAYPGLKNRLAALSMLSKLFWLALWVLGSGLALLVLPLLYVLALAAHYYCMARLHTRASPVLPARFPDLEARFQACCKAVRMTRAVDCYLIPHDAALGRLTLRFLRRYRVVLRADTLAALGEDARALNFYIGHELGHIGQDAMARQWWAQVALLAPLLGAAAMRARHYTADRFGLACCRDASSAMRALEAMSGGEPGPGLAGYAAEATRGGRFLVSLRELCRDTPPLCKRVLRLRPEGHAPFPRRHPLAVPLAALVPRTPFGMPGGLALYCALAVLLLAVGQLAPRRSDVPRADTATSPAKVEPAPSSTQRSDKLTLSQAYASGMAAADDIDLFIIRRQRAPMSVREAGFIASQEHVLGVVLEPTSGVLSVTMREPLAGVKMTLAPHRQDGRTVWTCSLPPEVDARAAPRECRGGDAF